MRLLPELAHNWYKQVGVRGASQPGMSRRWSADVDAALAEKTCDLQRVWPVSAAALCDCYAGKESSITPGKTDVYLAREANKAEFDSPIGSDKFSGLRLLR